MAIVEMALLCKYKTNLYIGNEAAVKTLPLSLYGVSIIINFGQMLKTDIAQFIFSAPSQELMASEVPRIAERLQGIVKEMHMYIAEGHTVMLCCSDGLIKSPLLALCSELHAKTTQAEIKTLLAKIDRVYCSPNCKSPCATHRVMPLQSFRDALIKKYIELCPV